MLRLYQCSLHHSPPTGFLKTNYQERNNNYARLELLKQLYYVQRTIIVSFKSRSTKTGVPPSIFINLLENVNKSRTSAGSLSFNALAQVTPDSVIWLLV
jgi:hypothetical protein